MRVKELHHDHVHLGEWVVDWSRTGECDYSNMWDVIRIHRPVLQLDLLPVLRPQLDEMTFKGLMSQIDPDFLRQGLRVRDSYVLDGVTYQGPKILQGVSYQGFEGDTMKFLVTHSTEYPQRAKPPYYENLIRFLNWDDVGSDANMTPREKATLLMWTSDVQLHCTDPSFLYWGYQYILTQLNAAMVPEGRYPDINNPELRGIVCKHLNRVLHVLPFYMSDIAKAITEEWGGSVSKRELDAIRRRANLQQQENAQNAQLPPEQDVPQPGAEEEELPENPDETPPTA